MNAKKFIIFFVLILLFILTACAPKNAYWPAEENSGDETYIEESENFEETSEENQTWYAVHAQCENETVPIDKTISIWYHWGTLEEQQGAEYFDFTDHAIYVDDMEVPIQAEGMGETFFDEEEGFYKTEHWLDIGYLEPGYHEIVTVAIPREQVFDGWDWFGPGTDTEYVEYYCSVSVGDEIQEQPSLQQVITQEQTDEEGVPEGGDELCNASKFVSETIPDHTMFSPGERFQKQWIIRNVGTCEWNTAYTFVFTQGNRMGGAQSQNLLYNVPPGETVTFTLDLTAPDNPGVYTGRWEIYADNGELLGWYSVVIDVLAPGQQQLPQDEVDATIIIDPLIPFCGWGNIFLDGFLPNEDVDLTVLDMQNNLCHKFSSKMDQNGMSQENWFGAACVECGQFKISAVGRQSGRTTSGVFIVDPDADCGCDSFCCNN